MDALTTLVSFYNSCPLDDTYRQVACNVLRNIYLFPTSSSYQMADLCFTAPSTLRRLVSKLGYKSYTAFKSELNWSLENYRYLNVYRPLNIDHEHDPITVLMNYIADAAAETEKSIDRAYMGKIVRALRDFKKVVFFVSAPTYQIQRFQTDLLLAGHEVVLYTNLHDQLSQAGTLDRNCFVIFIKPEVPVTSNIRKLAQLAKAKGAQTLLITNNKSYVPNDILDFVLSFNGAASLIDIFTMEMYVAAIVTTHQGLVSSSD